MGRAKYYTRVTRERTQACDTRACLDISRRVSRIGVDETRPKCFGEKLVDDNWEKGEERKERRVSPLRKGGSG